MLRVLAIISTLVFVTGCQTFQETKKSGRISIGEAYSIDPQVSWRRANRDGLEIWTVDGPILQELVFMKAVKDGASLPIKSRQSPENKPRFNSKMSPSEIMEIVIASLDTGKRGQIKATNLRPMKFGKAQGFRFDISWTNEKGLPYSAIVAAAKFDETLELILYKGDSLHHFAKFHDAVEKMLASIQLIKT